MIDPRVRTFLLPTRIVWSDKIDVVDSLLHNDASVCAMPPGSAVILDFGKELHGGLRFDVPTTSPKGSPVVRIRFGESVSETLNTPDEDHAIHDQTIKLAWMGRTEVGETGFRFAHIENIDPVHTIHIKSILAVSVERPLHFEGSFACSDERLNEIWRVGARTVHLCMQDHVWDGIKRDRLVWIGDLHPEAMVILSVFGGHEIVPQSLDFVRDSTPLPQWMNGISSYSLWWVLIQRDWWRYTGNKHYLRQQKDYLIGLLSHLWGFLGDDGGERLDGMRFLEWPTARDPEAINAGLQALVALTFEAGAELLGVLNEPDLAARFDRVAAKARMVVRPTTSKQASALLVLAKMAEASQINTDILARDPFRALSTFYGYYVLQARALAGDIDGALELIRTYWGGMLDMGATTFWEGFEIDWMENSFRIDELPIAGKRDIHGDFGDHCYVGFRHSLCHGWAAGPTAFLTETVLGITPASPGFATVHCDPQLGGLAWARGTVPTPHGTISVSHTRESDGSITTKLDLPEGVTRA